MRVILEIPEKEEGLYLPEEMLEEAGLSSDDGLSYTIEEGRILIERAESYEKRILEEDWEDARRTNSSAACRKMRYGYSVRWGFPLEKEAKIYPIQRKRTHC